MSSNPLFLFKMYWKQLQLIMQQQYGIILPTLKTIRKFLSAQNTLHYITTEPSKPLFRFPTDQVSFPLSKRLGKFFTHWSVSITWSRRWFRIETEVTQGEGRDHSLEASHTFGYFLSRFGPHTSVLDLFSSFNIIGLTFSSLARTFLSIWLDCVYLSFSCVFSFWTILRRSSIPVLHFTWLGEEFCWPKMEPNISK